MKDSGAAAAVVLMEQDSLARVEATANEMERPRPGRCGILGHYSSIPQRRDLGLSISFYVASFPSAAWFPRSYFEGAGVRRRDAVLRSRASG